jgi:hypothetical protein
MNDTLSRFESRISVLGREKKTLESEIDKIREKQALTQKIDANRLTEQLIMVDEARDRKEER